jgi:hypothetical protein
MRRAHMVWTKSAPDIAVTPTPPPNAQFYEHTRGATLAQIRGIGGARGHRLLLVARISVT